MKRPLANARTPGSHPHSNMKIRPGPTAASAKTLVYKRKRGTLFGSNLEDLLTSALFASDRGLSDLVKEIDQISESLKRSSQTTGAHRVATHPAVWCALKHMIAERELQHLALTDDLTCLYNRRGFFAAATQQLKLARRNGHRMLLLFCDLDHLKQINDSYGHREGDLALVRMADALEGTFRDSDILARLGGDEFAVLAPEASDQSLKTLLARLSRNLDKANEGESRYDLSVSVGYARFEPKRPMPLADLIAEADRIMYQSRANLEFGPRATLAPKNR